MTSTPAVKDESSIEEEIRGNHGEPGETVFAGVSELRAVLEWLESEPTETKSWRVIKALTTESIKTADRTTPLRRFTDEDLASAAEIDGFGWRDVEHWWKKREPTIVLFLKSKGIERAPSLATWGSEHSESQLPKTGRGNKAERYFSVKVIADNSDSGPNSNELPEGHVRYERTEAKLTPSSWLFRWLLNEGQVKVGSIRFRVFKWLALTAASVFVFLGVVVALGMIFTNKQVGTGDIVSAAVIGFCIYLWRNDLLPLIRAREDRITALPEEWVKGEHQRAQLERFRTPDGEVLRLVQYSCPCPECGSELHLSPGEPEFPGRVVGRCIDAPREHVRSFDPVSKTGAPLR